MVTPQVATQGAESAVHDSLVFLVFLLSMFFLFFGSMRQIKLAYVTDLLSARENGASYRRRCDADAGCVVVSLMYATWSVGTRHDAVCCGCRLWRVAATVTQCRVRPARIRYEHLNCCVCSRWLSPRLC